MKSLKTFLAGFDPPMQTPEQRAAYAEYERTQRQREHSSRVSRACIPPLFCDADIASCCEQVKSYSASISNNGVHVAGKNGLVLRGKVGRGKTHCACAVLIDHVDDFPVRFTTMQGVLHDIQSSFGSSTRVNSVIGAYMTPRILVVDDFGKERPTEWSLPIMFNIIDGRYASLKQTIYTTQYTGKELAERLTVNGDRSFADAILSRMSTCEPVIFDGENRRANG